jgi:hypothetical protein
MKQTFSRIDIAITTGIGKSKTEATFITHDPDGSSTLYAIYKNEIFPEYRSTRPNHTGVAKLQIEGDPHHVNRFTGLYWTDKPSHGRVEARRLSDEAYELWLKRSAGRQNPN